MIGWANLAPNLFMALALEKEMWRKFEIVEAESNFSEGVHNV